MTITRKDSVDKVLLAYQTLTKRRRKDIIRAQKEAERLAQLERAREKKISS